MRPRVSWRHPLPRCFLEVPVLRERSSQAEAAEAKSISSFVKPSQVAGVYFHLPGDRSSAEQLPGL